MYYQSNGQVEVLHPSIDLHGLPKRKHQVFTIIANRPRPKPTADEGTADA